MNRKITGKVPRNHQKSCEKVPGSIMKQLGKYPERRRKSDGNYLESTGIVLEKYPIQH